MHTKPTFLSISFDDGLAYFVIVAAVLFLLFMAIIAIKERIAVASKDKVKREILIKTEIDKELEDLKKQNAELSERYKELRQERDDLKEKLSYLNQQDWKKRYNELNLTYYHLYEQYVKDPTLSVEDLFPTDDETISIIKLQTKLNTANGKIEDLQRRLGAKNRECKEYQNEKEALQFELDELFSDYKECQNEVKELRTMRDEMFSDAQALLQYIDQQEEEEEEERKADKLQLKEISDALKKNSHLFYNSSEEIKKFYSGMDSKRVYNSFDTTLCFKDISYITTHSDNTKSYTTTLTSCTCPDFKDNLKGAAPCKHMIFLAYHIGNLFVNKEASDKYFKEDIGFLSEKQKITEEIKKLKNERKKIKKEIKELKIQKTALSDGPME